jgi:hypothetical protein
MSTLLDAEIVNAVVLVAVLQADLGKHRTISKFRLLRPLILAAAIVPIFLDKVTTHGGGLTVELAGCAAGLVGGLAAVLLMRVYRSDKTGKPVSSAGWGYALLWTGVIVARALFSYGANHWFENQIGSWLITNSIPATAITDGLIFMAVVMLLTRTAGLGIRSRSVAASGAEKVPTPDRTLV